MILLSLAAALAPIDYRIAVRAGREAPLVTVTMTFTGDADGETEVALPTRWAGTDGLWRAIGPPIVTGGQRVASGVPERWRFRHAPDARLTLRYEVRDGQPGRPDAATFEKAFPVVERTWLYVHNQGAIAIPTGREAHPARFAIDPPSGGWRLASDLTGADALTAGAVSKGVVVGGTAMRIETRRVGRATLRVVVLGDWSFTDTDLADRVQRLMMTENAMLAAPETDYLVALAPIAGGRATGAISYGGTGTTAGFAMESTDNVPLAEMTRTLAHEYAHRWFGRGFGPVAEGAGAYWFTEGANDWFAARAMVRSGLWTRADWVTGLNRVLRRYGISTARPLSDAELTRQFWTNPDAMQVQYDRGNLTTLMLDRTLGPAGGLVPILARMARAPAVTPQDAVFAGAVDAARHGAMAAARMSVSAPLPADALAECGRIVDVTEARYDRGFDIDDTRIVTKVRTDAARGAGIRVGMRYMRRLSFEPDTATVPYVAEFGSGNAVRTLRWLPAGSTSVTFQRLDATAIHTPACSALVAGTPPTP